MSLHCPFWNRYTRSLLNFLFSRLNSPSTPNLSSWVRLSKINAKDLHGHLSMSVVCWGAQQSQNTVLCSVLDTELQMRPHSANRGEGWHPSTCWLYFVQYSPGYYSLSLLKGHTASSCSNVHQDLFWKLFFSCVTAIMCCCMGLFLPRCRTSPCGDLWGMCKYLGLRWL